MNLKFLAAVLVFPLTAQAYDLGAMQQQIMNNPEIQQAVGQQVMKQATQPGAATTGMGMLGNVLGGSTKPATPAATGQNALLMQALSAATSKYLTPTEQKSLKAYQATPAGSGVMAKLPQIAQELMPVLLQMYGQK